MIRSISSMSATMPDASLRRAPHFDAEAQPRERRAQVVRNAGEQDRAIVLELAQARDHGVDAAVELRFPKARARAAVGRLAAADRSTAWRARAAAARGSARTGTPRQAARRRYDSSTAPRATIIFGRRTAAGTESRSGSRHRRPDAHEQQPAPGAGRTRCPRPALLEAVLRRPRVVRRGESAESGRSPRARSARRIRGRAARARRARSVGRALQCGRSACSWTSLVSPNWREISATRSWRKIGNVATSAIATTRATAARAARTAFAARESRRRAFRRERGGASSSGTNT